MTLVYEGKGNLGVYAMKREAAGAHLRSPWLMGYGSWLHDDSHRCVDNQIPTGHYQ